MSDEFKQEISELKQETEMLQCLVGMLIAEISANNEKPKVHLDQLLGQVQVILEGTAEITDSPNVTKMSAVISDAARNQFELYE